MSNSSTLENNTSACANCGKGEEAAINLKACTACKLVKYCSRDCQIAHRPQHKKACKKRAAELHDIKLFKQPPPLEDCPICMIRLPNLDSEQTYMPCCGKIICTGCVHAFRSRATKREHDVCPFCRTPPPNSDEESRKWLEKRMEFNDADAIYGMGSLYSDGELGLPRDQAKALELWHRAGELGSAEAYYNIANAYMLGRGVERDEKKTLHYYELAAMRGQLDARHNLGCLEEKAGNVERALKHYVIAARDGDPDALRSIKGIYMDGNATKDDYTTALRYYQAYLDEIKSDQRDEAAAVRNISKYY